MGLANASPAEPWLGGVELPWELPGSPISIMPGEADDDDEPLETGSSGLSGKYSATSGTS